MVLPVVLGIHNPDGSHGSMRAAAVMYKMIESAVREIEYYLPDEAEFYMPEIRAIRGAVSPLVYSTGMDLIKSKLTEAHVIHIRHTGQRLKKLAPELTLWPNELDHLLESINELRDMVDNLDLNESAKHRLRQRCGSLRTSVEEYRFWGVEEIEVCFESTQAAMIPFVKREPSGSPKPSWKKIGAAIIGISTILGNANTVAKNVQESFTLLESGAKTAVEHSSTIIEAVEEKLRH
jgi:hypothetical protein